MTDTKMRFITVRLVIDDVNNLSDAKAIEDVSQLISEVFSKEERQEHPRCKLVLMEVKHTYDQR